MGCHSLLQGIFLPQGWNLCLPSPALAGGFFITSATWEAQEGGGGAVKKTVGGTREEGVRVMGQRRDGATAPRSLGMIQLQHRGPGGGQ